MDIGTILKYKFPGIDLIRQVIIQDDGDGPYIKKWDNSLGPFPTTEILASWEQEYRQYLKSPDYLNKVVYEKRRAEYPAIGDQLDALLKQFDDMELAGLNLNPEFRQIKDQWNAVKVKYPKVQGE